MLPRVKMYICYQGKNVYMLQAKNVYMLQG